MCSEAALLGAAAVPPLILPPYSSPPPPSSLLPSLTLLPSQQFDRPLFFPSSVSPSGFSFVPLMSPSSTGCCGQSSRSDTPHPSVLYSLPPSTPHFLFSAVILKFLSLQIQMIFVFVCLVHHFKNKRFSVYLIIFYYLTDLNNFLFFLGKAIKAKEDLNSISIPSHKLINQSISPG